MRYGIYVGTEFKGELVNTLTHPIWVRIDGSVSEFSPKTELYQMAGYIANLFKVHPFAISLHPIEREINDDTQENVTNISHENKSKKA